MRRLYIQELYQSNEGGTKVECLINLLAAYKVPIFASDLDMFTTSIYNLAAMSNPR
jgi:hypothetical protein